MSIFVINPSSSSGVPRPNSRRWAYIAADGGTTIPANKGIGDNLVSSVDASGVTSGGAAGSTNPAFFSGSIASSVAGHDTHFNGSSNYRVGRNIRFQTIEITASTFTLVRTWVGLVNGNPAGTDTPTTLQLAAFRASTSASDTHYQCVTSDGAAETITDSGVTIDTLYHRFEIIFNDAIPNVQFFVDGNLVATNTTHLPASGTNLFWATTIALPSGSSSRVVSVGWVYVESDL